MKWESTVNVHAIGKWVVLTLIALLSYQIKYVDEF